MTENWKQGPNKLILIIPIIDEGTPNGIVHTNADDAAKSLMQHDRSRIDIIYRNRSHSWVYTFDRKINGDARKFMNNKLADIELTSVDSPTFRRNQESGEKQME